MPLLDYSPEDLLPPAKRYELLLTKLLRERLYDGATLILSTKVEGKKGQLSHPSPELSFNHFAAGRYAHAVAFASTH